MRDMLWSYGVPPDGRVSAVGKKVLPLPRFLREPISRIFPEGVHRRHRRLLLQRRRRAAIRKQRPTLLPGPGTPVTLVAHSQGSIVALEVLARAAEA